MTNQRQRLEGAARIHAPLFERLLASTALAGTAACSLLVVGVLTAAQPALADGGDGGPSNAGAGATGFNGTAGGNAGATGGGGGGGAGGGAGGSGDNGNAAGGAGGTSISKDGSAGDPTSVGVNGGGGGGGGGWNGNGAGAATITNAGSLSGGNGGAGGRGTSGIGSGGGGGGGAGGYGAIITGSSGTSTNSGSISGGIGGIGGAGQGTPGDGGDGGVGVQFSSSGGSLTNSGTIAGGTGGAGGPSINNAIGGGGAGGNGGAGIAGSGVTITNTTAGSITGANGGAAGTAANFASAAAGGNGGAGITGSNLTVINAGAIAGGSGGAGTNGGATGTAGNAITFTGGSNSLELQSGSNITGNVVAFSNVDILKLGGTTNASFDVSQIGAGQQYQGFGVFQKTGSSTWTLTGINNGVTPWTVNAGTLAVDGSLTNSSSAVTVNTGGTLAGTGSIGGNVVVSGGTFAPGSGTAGSSMTGLANLTMSPGSTYRVFVDPTTASSATFTGTASLGGTANAQFAAGVYVANSYTILSAASINGQFSSLTTNNLPTGFAAALDYSSPSGVVLNLTALLGTGGRLPDNQQNVADAINNFFNNGGTLPPEFADLFNLTGGALSNALAKRSGEVATGASQGSFQLMNMFLNVMLDPFVNGRGATPGGMGLGFAPDQPTLLPPDAALAYDALLKTPGRAPAYDPRYSVWGTAFGGSNNRDGDATGVGSHDINSRAGGFAAGVDYRIGQDTVVGAALAGGVTNWSLSGDLGSGKSDAFQAGLYGVTRSGPAYLAGAFGYSRHWMSTDRTVAGDNLSADFDANNFGGRVEAGYRFDAPWIAVTPYAAGQVQSFHAPSYSEKGGSFGLDFDSRTSTATRVELGSRFDKLWMLADGSTLSWRGRAAWAHDWTSDPSLTAAFQALPGASFLVTGAEPVKNSALLSIGPEWRSPSGLSLSAKFDAELAEHSTTYAGTGTLRYTW